MRKKLLYAAVLLLPFGLVFGVVLGLAVHFRSKRAAFAALDCPDKAPSPEDLDETRALEDYNGISHGESPALPAFAAV